MKILRALPLFVLAILTCGAAGQTLPGARLPSGTPLWLETRETVPLRVGEPVRAYLSHPVFLRDTLVLPEGTLLSGIITALVPEHGHRVQARLRGDFTPFSQPVVQFTSLTPAGGSPLPVLLTAALAGAPLLRLLPPPSAKGGVIRRQFDAGLAAAKDQLRTFTGPNKRDRLVQFLYTQLPYHPQRIERATAWTVETRGAFDVPPIMSPPTPQADKANALPQNSASSPTGPAPSASERPVLQVEAALNQDLSSETAVAGQKISATVVRPSFGSDGSVAVPQGAVLEGTVIKAKHSGRFGRTGQLRFIYSQLTLPGETRTARIQSNLTGIDATQKANLKLDREGTAKPAPKDKIVVPLILLVLASRPLDRDRGDNAFGKSAVASNSLGMVGFLVGTAGGWRNVAAGIGYYGAALAIWDRWIKRGQDVTFRKNTRIVLETSVRQSALL